VCVCVCVCVCGCVCVCVCVNSQVAANEALPVRGNPIDGALSPDNADQLYCIDCISPSLAPMRCVCVCVCVCLCVCVVCVVCVCVCV